MGSVYDRLKKITKCLPELTEGQLYWLERVLEVFVSGHEFVVFESDVFDRTSLNDFGDALRIHHCFSSEPFSKDKFEYVFNKVLQMNGFDANLAPRGNPGYDMTIGDQRFSLKTQADKAIRSDRLWISKFMELGKGVWGDNPADLEALRSQFLDHLSSYDRILVLRALEKAPHWHYELVEIHKEILEQARQGTLEMKMESKQYPKPGYCYVRLKDGTELYKLYFDGGSERKLQIKALNKACCTIHADWQFSIPEA